MERRTEGGSVFYPQMPELVPDLSYLFPEQSKAAPSAFSWQQARLCSVDCHGLTCPGCQCRQPPSGCRSGSGSGNTPPQRRRCSRSLPSSICPSLRICTRQIRYASLIDQWSFIEIFPYEKGESVLRVPLLRLWLLIFQSKQARMTSMMRSCCSGVILLSEGRHRPLRKMSSPTSRGRPSFPRSPPLM